MERLRVANSYLACCTERADRRSFSPSRTVPTQLTASADKAATRFVASEAICDGSEGEPRNESGDSPRPKCCSTAVRRFLMRLARSHLWRRAPER